MSRSTTAWSLGGSSFPRVSGDEPFEGDVDLLTVEFSPRERG